MPEPSEQAAVAEAPAPAAPERSTGKQILEKAKAEIKGLNPDVPAPAEGDAQDSATPPPDTAPAPPPAAEKEQPEQESSRRSANKELRERIRKEVQAEFQAELQAAEAYRESQRKQQEFDALVAKADAGDWEAKDQLVQRLKGDRGMQTAMTQTRNALLAELGNDVKVAIYGLDGLDDDGQTALMKAPSVGEFAKAAFAQGRRIEKALHEGTIATLKAENESLKGRLAGSSPSPTATNGSGGIRAENGRFKSIHDAYMAAAADLGYRPQG